MTRKTIVVVDDEPGFCDTIADLLADEGYAVETAVDGGAGLALLRRLDPPPCLLILDLFMPVLDGHAVYRAMRADPALAAIPVVICTSDPDSAPPGLQVLTKPVSLVRVLETVRAACGAPDDRR